MTSRARTLRKAGLALLVALLAVPTTPSLLAQEKASTPSAAPKQKTFESAKAAVEALVAASEAYDVPALKEILGPDGTDLVVTEDAVLDRKLAKEFAAKAHEKLVVVPDPKKKNRATFTFGADDWPMAIPVVKEKAGWRFDSKAGKHEVLIRRIGRNELDAIEICRGYVEAQNEYASRRHDGARVNQYAQKIVSTPGKRDGLAWKGADGTWKGPVGEGVAKAIAEGYHDRMEPYHGYHYKVLKGQGPAAPLGQMDFFVQGAMIGGFALVATPADYGVTGIKTFIVSHDGVVYEKDLGKKTSEIFRAMERFDPGKGWTPVPEN